MSAVTHALRVLEAVGRMQPVGVSALARELSMSKTTTQRALQSLAEEDWIVQAIGDTTRWVLTTKAFAVGSQHVGATSLRELARPQMKALFDKVGETVHLSVTDGTTLLVVDLIETDQPIRAYTKLGQRYPMHATSSGLAMLAAMDPEEAERLVASAPMDKLTERTPTDRAEIMRLVAETRDRGYGIALGTRHPDIAAIAAPILDRRGHPSASLSISAPMQRMPASRHAEYGALVRAAAEKCNGIYLSYT